MKTVTHTMYPVSYIDDEGKQQDQLYTFSPSEVRKDYWVGEPIEVVTEHPVEMDDKARIAKILFLKEKLAALEAGDANN